MSIKAVCPGNPHGRHLAALVSLDVRLGETLRAQINHIQVAGAIVKDLLESRDAAELRQMIDLLGIVAFIIDVDDKDIFRLMAINNRHEQVTGMRQAQVAGKAIDDILPAQTAARVENNYRKCVRQRRAINYQETLELPVGTTYWRTTLVPYMDGSGRVFRLLGTSFEVSYTVHLELETRYQSTVMGAYLDESPDGILVVSSDNEIKTWNRRFLDLWGIPEAVMQQRDGAAALQAVRRQLQNPDDFIERVMNLFNHLDEEERGYRFSLRDGRIFERYSRGLRDEQGMYWGRIWFYRDVTEHQRLTEELLSLARTDSLTQIHNRRAFMEQLATEFSRAQRYGHALSVLMIDLDHFKSINDRYGHSAGDTALRAFVDATRALLRDTDEFARMGGEEFAILLPETDIEEGERIAWRLCEAIAQHLIDGPQDSFTITASIGVAHMQPEDGSGEAALSRADRALYTAKKTGRNRAARAADDDLRDAAV